MKAKQLIERLKDFPEDTEVCIEGSHYPAHIGDIKLISNYDYNIIILTCGWPINY